MTLTDWFPPLADDEMAKLAWIWVLLTELHVAVILEPAEIVTPEQLEPKPFPLSVTEVVPLTGPCAGEMLLSAGLTSSVPMELRCMIGHEYCDMYHGSSAKVVEVVEPAPWPVKVPQQSTVATLGLLVVQLPSKSPLTSVHCNEHESSPFTPSLAVPLKGTFKGLENLANLLKAQQIVHP